MSTPPLDPSNPDTNTSRRRTKAATGSTTDSDDRVAYTLTACCRCRARKTRCDPSLPRCGPCERTNSHCEYFDPARGLKIPRNYVVYLQRKAFLLERNLSQLIKREPASTTAEVVHPDPEETLRGAASVRIEQSNECRYLGPASGIAVSRLVIQLAKEFSDTKNISDIVNEDRQSSMKSTFELEQAKPTSKSYPIDNNVPALELPNRDLVNQLKRIFYLKVHPMYPIFHEPTFDLQLDDVFNRDQDPFKIFFVRMMVAISLQKLDQQYAGLADSYYLAALQCLTACIKPMDLRTLQCCALMAVYSLLTPTRTAVYFVIGLAIRIVQSLGIHDEKTLGVTLAGKPKSALEIDMGRRMFWIIATMDFGLAHALGRPSSFSSHKDYIHVSFPAQVNDVNITHEGIVSGAPICPRKCVTTHFYQMRLFQLEIRRMLYLVKRPEPRDDCHPWFRDMERRLKAWQEACPVDDAQSGLNQVWFNGRFNTMMVFMLRPSPQVPRPSVQAAHKCFEACRFNIYMQRHQMDTKSIDLTWVFTQSLFMAVNTLLWSISYAQIRIAHPRDEVFRHLRIALEAISLAAERWPGVASALELYHSLTVACLKIYDNDLGDVSLPVYSPDERLIGANGGQRSSRPISMVAGERKAMTMTRPTDPPPPNQSALAITVPHDVPFSTTSFPFPSDYTEALAMLQGSTRAILQAEKDKERLGQMGFDTGDRSRQELAQLREALAAYPP